jgi:hypothetical protein
LDYEAILEFRPPVGGKVFAANCVSPIKIGTHHAKEMIQILEVQKNFSACP